jgi:hypothetical protein
MNLLGLWQRAAGEEIGLAISTPAPYLRLLQNKLYDARKGHPELMSLTLAMVGGDIWLVKDTVKRLDDARAPGGAGQEGSS